MACTFQQVFLTTSTVAPDTCLITTNRTHNFRVLKTFGRA
jgi:hypothetical protein